MGAPLPIPAGSLATIGPGLSDQVTGPGWLGRLLLTTELNYETRRACRPAPSPEYSPGAAIAGREGQGIKVDRGEPGPA
jgi:hypothetical protein